MSHGVGKSMTIGCERVSVNSLDDRLGNVNADLKHCYCLQVDYTPGSDQWNWLAYDLQVCSETGTTWLLFVLLASTCQGACWLLTWTALFESAWSWPDCG